MAPAKPVPAILTITESKSCFPWRLRYWKKSGIMGSSVSETTVSCTHSGMSHYSVAGKISVLPGHRVFWMFTSREVFSVLLSCTFSRGLLPALYVYSQVLQMWETCPPWPACFHSILPARHKCTKRRNLIHCLEHWGPQNPCSSTMVRRYDWRWGQCSCSNSKNVVHSRGKLCIPHSLQDKKNLPAFFYSVLLAQEK